MQRNYGFVEYTIVSNAEGAIARMNGHSNLIVKFATDEISMGMN